MCWTGPVKNHDLKTGVNESFLSNQHDICLEKHALFSGFC